MAQAWTLQRNCSLSPRQTGRAYALLCGFSVGIGLAFAWTGVLIVLAFALLETAAITLALLHYARHATDGERIALADGTLLVERETAGRTARFRLDPAWTRIALAADRQALIRLQSRDVTVEVGSFVAPAIRRRVARELRGALGAVSALPQPPIQ